MNHDELLARIDNVTYAHDKGHTIDKDRIVKQLNALRAVVELHKPKATIRGYRCKFDDEKFPCKHHQAIEKVLQ